MRVTEPRSKKEINGKVLAIDFDLTICMSAYPELGEERKGAKKYINKLYNLGYGIVINTCRTQEAEGMAVKWLEDNAIGYDYINCNFPYKIKYFGMDCRKISADYYIDDKCIAGLPSWKKIYKILKDK